jgi:hypothetical protein
MANQERQYIQNMHHQTSHYDIHLPIGLKLDIDEEMIQLVSIYLSSKNRRVVPQHPLDHQIQNQLEMNHSELFIPIPSPKHNTTNNTNANPSHTFVNYMPFEISGEKREKQERVLVFDTLQQKKHRMIKQLPSDLIQTFKLK